MFGKKNKEIKDLQKQLSDCKDNLYTMQMLNERLSRQVSDLTNRENKVNHVICSNCKNALHDMLDRDNKDIVCKYFACCECDKFEQKILKNKP